MWKLLVIGLLLVVIVSATFRRADSKTDTQRRGSAAGNTRGVKAFVTSGDKREAAVGEPIEWSSARAAIEDNEIRIDRDKKYQEVRGFGAAFTDAACFMFDKLSADSRAKLFRTLFHPSEMGLNVCRVCMGASDYATHLYSYCDGDEDRELKNFSIAHDEKYILPMIKEARAQNPDLFLFASPWSPPGWMKAGKSMLGGSMRREYFEPYAQYFVKFVNGYKAHGVPIDAVTVQNEVDTDQNGAMPACIWAQEYEVGFVSQHLGPAFEKAGIDTKIWIIDHNYNLWGRAIASLEATDMQKYTNAIAWHGYVGDAWRMTTVHNAYPKVDAYWTEGGPDVTNADYATDWVKWSKSFTTSMRNWCRGITAWNFALDEKGNPNIGPFPCGGLVTIDSNTKEIRQSGQFWAISHFSRHIKRGAFRVGSEGELKDVMHVAFVNPDGERVLVLTNGGTTSTTVKVKEAGWAFNIDLPADSVVTVSWN